MLFIGVDPGKQGAIAAITAAREIILLCDLPWWEDGRHDPHALVGFLDALPDQIFFSTLENVIPWAPNARNMMMLGKSFASVASILDLRSTHFLTPAARIWKKELGVTANKKSSILLAQTLFGQVALRADSAEALLLAEFGLRSHMLAQPGLDILQSPAQ